jgi:hypothetical protein
LQGDQITVIRNNWLINAFKIVSYVKNHDLFNHISENVWIMCYF